MIKKNKTFDIECIAKWSSKIDKVTFLKCTTIANAPTSKKKKKHSYPSIFF